MWMKCVAEMKLCNDWKETRKIHFAVIHIYFHVASKRKTFIYFFGSSINEYYIDEKNIDYVGKNMFICSLTYIKYTNYSSIFIFFLLLFRVQDVPRPNHSHHDELIFHQLPHRFCEIEFDHEDDWFVLAKTRWL